MSVENPVLTFNKHSIKKVILNVYHSFYYDFQKLHIDFYIADTTKSLTFDYETIILALYHIFNNSVKYIKPKLKLTINYMDNESSFYIIFKMKSIHIKSFECDKLFDDNYSGEKAIEAKKHGSGLSMGLIKKALYLNKAIFKINAGLKTEKIRKIDYSDNEFIIEFKHLPN